MNKTKKTKYKYIEFTFWADRNSWVCKNHKSYQRLGYVTYFARWKEWQFEPEPFTGFTAGCLDDIADFLNQLNREGLQI